MYNTYNYYYLTAKTQHVVIRFLTVCFCCRENCRRVFRTGITHEEWDVNWDGYKEDDE